METIQFDAVQLGELTTTRAANKAELETALKAKGYRVVESCINFRTQSSVDWYRKSGEPILLVEKAGWIRIVIACVGDVRIVGQKRGQFVYDGVGAEGKLTPWLKKHGIWETANCFEVSSIVKVGDEWKFVVGNSYDTLNEAVQALLQLCLRPFELDEDD